jgi:hypothetical protein
MEFGESQILGEVFGVEKFIGIEIFISWKRNFYFVELKNQVPGDCLWVVDKIPKPSPGGGQKL